MLSAEHPLDALELQWAQSVISARFGLADMAVASGRPVSEWAAALAAGEAPYPPNLVIAERFDRLRRLRRKRVSLEQIARTVRAPAAWCEEAMRRLPEMRRVA